MKYLTETALPTHGLRSISNEELRKNWHCPAAVLAWVDHGELRLGHIEDYLPFRERAAELVRIDCDHLEDALQNKISGALTASGTMAVCRKLGIPLAITTGYLLCGEAQPLELPLEAVMSEAEVHRLIAEGGLLILNPIPEEERVQDRSILADAVKAGKQAEAEGRYYHPAANGEIDRRTAGYSSRIQLESLQQNIQLAERIMGRE